MHRLITTTGELEDACRHFAHCEYVTVDTEFIREKTYFPKLCLVQIASDTMAVAVDPLSPELDLSSLFDLLANPKLLKVLHAAKQDVEIFFQLTGQIPTPMYDTQIAAMVCGYGEQVGYEALVNTLMNEVLDKASRYTDWEQRPLTQRQVDYAIADVTHLRGVYEKLHGRIAQTNREEWILEEVKKMQDPKQYRVDPDEIWRRLKYKNRTPSYLNQLRAVAAWRERTAQLKDIPRQRLLKDEVVLQIAAMAPKNMEELAQVRGAMKHISADNAKSLLAALSEANALPREAWPSDTKKKKMLSTEQEALVDVLKLLLKRQCDQADVASKLVAHKEDLAAMLLDPNPEEVPCLQGWRYELFGRLAQRFLSGELQLRVDPQTGGLTFGE
jgi:ribonuclease D